MKSVFDHQYYYFLYTGYLNSLIGKYKCEKYDPLNSNVYIRKYASKYSKILGTVKKGETFEWILDGMNENSGWRAIRYKGDHAWVSAQYSKVVEK